MQKMGRIGRNGKKPYSLVEIRRSPHLVGRGKCYDGNDTTKGSAFQNQSVPDWHTWAFREKRLFLQKTG